MPCSPSLAGFEKNGVFRTSRPVLHAGETRFEAVGLGHRLAHQRRLGQQFPLALGWVEGLTFPYPPQEASIKRSRSATGSRSYTL